MANRHVFIMCRLTIAVFLMYRFGSCFSIGGITTSVVLFENKGKIAFVTINRPEFINALDVDVRLAGA